MILDNLKQFSIYNFGPAWEKAFEFLRELDISIEPGRCVIDGEKVFAQVSEYHTKLQDEGRFEAHRKYVDIQFLLSGREILGWADLPSLETEIIYDPERDVEFLKPLPVTPSLSRLVPGMFMAFFPEDGHMPGLAVGNKPEAVKKVVVKIAVSALVS
ncbi:YhcH/YjgK/YiaL family protein [Maridesulfovibrio ferrireducens]|uniref:YhcH/YjgK/YiaL family protein n=1 Tax=Maridesulfovibrio ferrireducens TaxID=246191 RepID=UPI001A1D9125|nr:YhcH/YjgK/YiaL family protein [Maridesulfovibrio ferrireducens]MBI9111926.1 YhcH/YjgK/YiaL family protein [Maridesulfovibrio ferrireducens]